MTSYSKNTLRLNVEVGVKRGLYVAVVFTTYIAIQYLVGARRFEVGLFRLVAMFLALGAFGGGLAGLLLPLAKNRALAALVGVAVSFPIYVFGYYTMYGASEFNLTVGLAIAWAAIVTGGTTGFILHASGRVRH